MNVKRFTARNSREALRLVREALGDDAIVLSTKPAATGVEVMAMAPDSLGRLEAMAAEQEPAASPADAGAARRRAGGDERRAGRRPPLDEHALVPGLRQEAHAEAPPGVARSGERRHAGAGGADRRRADAGRDR